MNDWRSMNSFLIFMSTSTYFCRQCGFRTQENTGCPQCQSELIEERTTDDPVINDFEHIFQSDFDLQAFTNMLLPMLMSQTPTYRHRRSRAPRRIKRVTHTGPTHRNLPQFDLISVPRLFNRDEFLPRNNFTLVQIPLEFVIFDTQEEDLTSVPLTRNEIDQLPVLNMTSSNLTLNPSCAICLENFDLSSDVKQLVSCHHVFHRTCLTEWLLRHGNCPMCRSVISSRHRTAMTLVNDPWMEQLIFPTVERTDQTQSIQTIKTVNLPSIIAADPPDSTSNDDQQDQ